MSRNGSGTYSLPVGNPVVTGTTITSTWANSTLTDIASALTDSLAADGQTTASGNLNMGTNKIVNTGDPTNPQDVATKYYVDELAGSLGTMSTQDADDVDITGGVIDLRTMTNEVYLPVGTTAQRTASPTAGLIRWNTDAGGFYEGYNGTDWQRFLTANQGSYSISYVVVAGGAGGGANAGGGGGGGGVVINTLTAVPATTFSITVGAGGAGGANGSNSFITGITTAIGGGRGGSYGPQTGATGGSGGGASAADSGSYAGGLGTVTQGNSGGGSSNGSGSGGGGGGASAGAGGGFGASEGGAGGAGATLTITGTTTYVAGGGGGSNAYYGSGGAGAGGIGGGGAGAVTGSAGGNATANTGGGGGGGGAGPGVAAGNGGSGVVILSMPTANYTGTTTGIPTVTTSGSNTILRFTNSGSYTA